MVIGAVRCPRDRKHDLVGQIHRLQALDLFYALKSSTKGVATGFKSARGGVANTQGGTIVLGVAEKPTGLAWEGVPDAAQLHTVLWGQLNDRHKVSGYLRFSAKM